MRITTLSPILTFSLSLVAACAGDDGVASATETDASASSSAATSDASASSGGGTSSGGEASSSGGSSGGASDGETTGGDAWQPSACFDHWELMAELYPDAGALGPCVDVPGGDALVRSLLVLDGMTIDNNGQTMTPCVEARCDANYAYIGTNSLPHYDFVQTTPNALVENDVIVRIPLAPAAIAANADADPVGVHAGCGDAYDQYLQNPAQATTREPGLLCMYNAQDKAYLRETLESGDTLTYGKIACLGRTGVVTNGSPVYGPNEATIPDPYGSPLFFMPDLAGEPYLSDDLMGGAALDLCGGHTAASMHYHGVNEACFEQDDDGAPAKSYVSASQAWDMAAMLGGACVAESGIVGWSLDGYPIKGPCVCMARDAQGNCTEIQRARSSWVYAGLGAWGNDPQEDAALGIEGTTCVADDECCGGDVDGCDFRCSYVPVEGGGEGSEIGKVCTLLDYSWCTHEYVDRSTHPGGASFVYLDRCNGIEGADGYAYHTTASFPYINACYRAQPVDVEVMGGGGGMNPPKCMPGQMMCCGDGLCGGPETPQNCPEDC